MKNKILILLSIILFCISAFVFRHYLSIFYFQNCINKIAVNVETNKDVSDLYVCFNENCDKMSYLNKVYSYKLNQESPLFYNGIVNKIEIISKNKNLPNEIKSVSIFNGKDFNYYSNLKFNKKNISFQNENQYSYILPFRSNDKTVLQKISILFESIFYNWYFYILSYILIVFFLINKQNYSFKIKYPLAIILGIGFLLRYSHINYIPMWNDELYTVYFISDKIFNLKNAFIDPGNPPLFFILSNIWLLKFNETLTQIRLLPLLIGMFQIYSTYYVVDKILNKKVALISAFLCSINIFIIVQSNEIRSYILSMTLILWGGYFFYRLYQNFNRKNIILYTIISILLINTHFYTIIFVLFNILLGMFLFKKDKVKFLVINFIAFLSFIPYLIITMLNFSFDKNFNTWIPKPDILVLSNHITFYFGNIFFFITALIFSIFVIIKYLKNTIEKKVFIYNVLLISFTFIFCYVISVLIKPILFERYFTIFLPLLIINTAILINVSYKLKVIPLIVLLFSINMPKYENFNLFSNIHFFCKYTSEDYKNVDSKSKAIIIIPDKIEYLKKYPNIKKEDVIISQLGIREDRDLIKEYTEQIKKLNIKDKNIILYLPEICVNSKIKYSKDKNIQKINTTILPIYKIFLGNL